MNETTSCKTSVRSHFQTSNFRDQNPPPKLSSMISPQHLLILTIYLLVLKPKAVTFKVILLGNSGVGKTCIINRYVKNIFNAHTKSTIGVDFANKNILREDIGGSSTSVDEHN